MKYAQRLVFLTMAGIVAVGMTVAGCATPWFENKPKATPDPQPSAASASDIRSGAVAAYINTLCKMAREQRDTKIRELNEAVLPNHATISCGPGSGDGP
jgi:hypothetical protein